MDNGVLIDEISKEELHDRLYKFVEFEVSDIESSVKILKELGFRQNYDFCISDEGTIHLYSHIDSRDEINRLFVNSGINVKKVNLCEENLEDFFTRVITNS